MKEFKGQINDLNDLLFYDIESFKHDAFIVFKNIEKETVAKFHNNFNGIHEVIKDKILVGFNNYHYDDFILSCMMLYYTPEQIKSMNDRIIVHKERKPIKIDRSLKTLDTFQQSSVGFSSLKKIEGNMGRSIIESKVPFDLDRPLNKEEIIETFEYCEYDVEMTVDIFEKRKESYFNTKALLNEMVEIKNSYRWNTTTLSANALLKKPLPKWSGIRVPEDMFSLVPDEVVQMWTDFNKSFSGKVKKKSHTIKDFDCEIVFGLGGLHGRSLKYKDIENVKLLDVASMYPSIIINLEVLGPATAKYKAMKDERVKIKHIDRTRSDALKLVLNSVYGQLNSKYSILHNPKATATVCIYGQIALYELCKRLSVVAEIVNINTDGVAFITEDDRYLDIWKQWEIDFNMVLEEDDFKRFIQKDVNNYISLTSDDKVLTKGVDVGRYGAERIFENNSIRIIDIAVTEYILNGTDVIETLYNNLKNPVLFQYILQAGPTYIGTVDAEDNLLNKVNRVFATKGDEYTTLYKKRINKGLVRFPDTPDKMFLHNNDVSTIEDFESMIDLNFYYELIQRKLDNWDILV